MKKKSEKKIQISTFSVNGHDVELLLNRGKIAYTFFYNDKRYGQSVRIAGTKKLDVVNACMALLINYLETYDAVQKNSGTISAEAGVESPYQQV
jgi:hypothetical protein